MVMPEMTGEKITPPGSESQLARLLERGRASVADRFPTILSKCPHPPDKLKVTARGAHSLVVVCRCGSGTLALLVPARPMSSAETDLLIKLGRESEW